MEASRLTLKCSYRAGFAKSRSIISVAKVANAFHLQVVIGESDWAFPARQSKRRRICVHTRKSTATAAKAEGSRLFHSNGLSSDVDATCFTEFSQALRRRICPRAHERRNGVAGVVFEDTSLGGNTSAIQPRVPLRRSNWIPGAIVCRIVLFPRPCALHKSTVS
jgi:hypothetical protein